MKLKVFTLKLDPGMDRIDDTEIQDFLKDREALSVSEHFLVHEQVPMLILLVTWKETQKTETRRLTPAPGTEVVVADTDRGLYEAIKRWRNNRSKNESRPAYIYLNNREMAEVARQRPASLEELGRIDGIGDIKLAQYGEEILALVRTHPEQAPPAKESIDAT